MARMESTPLELLLRTARGTFSALLTVALHLLAIIIMALYMRSNKAAALSLRWQTLILLAEFFRTVLIRMAILLRIVAVICSARPPLVVASTMERFSRYRKAQVI